MVLALLLIGPTIALRGSALQVDPPTIEQTCIADEACVDVRLVVDEDGDNMTGDLGFDPEAGIAFLGGRLTGNLSLAFGGLQVCLAAPEQEGCGDLTGLTAGPGLLGGGSSGALDLALDFTGVQARLASDCAEGSSIRAVAEDGTVTCETDDDSTPLAGLGLLLENGAFSADLAALQARVGAVCAPGSSIREILADGAVLCEDDDGSGNVQLIETGAGLLGGPITTSGTISIAPGGIVGSMVQNGTLGLDKLGFDPATQTELTAALGALAAPGTLNATTNPLEWTKLKGVPSGFVDGVDAADPRAGFATGQLEARGNVNFPAIASASGVPLIAYNGDDLVLLRCLNAACSSTSTTTVDTAGGIGTAIAARSSSDTVVAYLSGPQLKLARCDASTCTAANLATVTSFISSSVAYASTGELLVAYTAFHPNFTIYTAIVHCASNVCGSPTITTLDGLGASNPDVIYGSDGLGLIAYQMNSVLKVAHCSVATCATWTTSTHDTFSSQQADIVLAPNGRALLAYSGLGRLKAAACADVACTSSTNATLDLATQNIQPPSIAIGSDGLGLIAYGNSSGLRMAHCTTASCSAATSAVADTPGGSTAGVVPTSDGLAVVAHLTVSIPSTLRISKCTTVACSATTLAGIQGAHAVGTHASATMGADGLGVMSYYDSSTKDLRLAACLNPACTSARSIAADSADDVGQYSAIALAEDGRWLVSYYDATDGDLRVGYCNLPCETASRFLPRSIDTTGDVGRYTSIAMGSDRFLMMSYFDATNGDLKVARCDAFCSLVSTTAIAVDTVGTVGEHTSLAIGADGLAIVSYYDATNGDLKVAHCNVANCSAATVSTLDSAGDVGRHTSIAIGVDGRALISYHDATNGDVKVARCADLACTSATNATLDAVGIVGLGTSIAVGPDGYALVAYYDVTNGNLKVARCDATCTSAASIATVESSNNVGNSPTLTFGGDGFALIVHHDATQSGVKATHCSNRYCLPYVRAR